MPEIVASQKKVAQADPLAIWIDSSKGPIANGAHYNTEGTLRVGQLFAKGLLKLEHTSMNPR